MIHIHDGHDSVGDFSGGGWARGGGIQKSTCILLPTNTNITHKQRRSKQRQSSFYRVRTQKYTKPIKRLDPWPAMAVCECAELRNNMTTGSPRRMTSTGKPQNHGANSRNSRSMLSGRWAALNCATKCRQARISSRPSRETSGGNKNPHAAAAEI